MHKFVREDLLNLHLWPNSFIWTLFKLFFWAQSNQLLREISGPSESAGFRSDSVLKGLRALCQITTAHWGTEEFKAKGKKWMTRQVNNKMKITVKLLKAAEVSCRYGSACRLTTPLEMKLISLCRLTGGFPKMRRFWNGLSSMLGVSTQKTFFTFTSCLSCGVPITKTY